MLERSDFGDTLRSRGVALAGGRKEPHYFDGPVKPGVPHQTSAGGCFSLPPTDEGRVLLRPPQNLSAT